MGPVATAAEYKGELSGAGFWSTNRVRGVEPSADHSKVSVEDALFPNQGKEEECGVGHPERARNQRCPQLKESRLHLARSVQTPIAQLSSDNKTWSIYTHLFDVDWGAEILP